MQLFNFSQHPLTSGNLEQINALFLDRYNNDLDQVHVSFEPSDIVNVTGSVDLTDPVGPHIIRLADQMHYAPEASGIYLLLPDHPDLASSLILYLNRRYYDINVVRLLPDSDTYPAVFNAVEVLHID